MFREFKVNFMIMQGAEVLDYGSINSGLLQDCITIPVFDNDMEHEAIAERLRKQRERKERLRNPTRAMLKQELRRMIEEEDYEH